MTESPLAGTGDLLGPEGPVRSPDARPYDAARVEAWTAGREILHRETLGRVASVTVLGHLSDADRAELAASDLDLAPVSLQQLIVRLTQNAAPAASAPVSASIEEVR